MSQFLNCVTLILIFDRSPPFAMVAVPFCRCRVLYIGSAVPTITKDGLQGIQQPLRERYPIGGNGDTKGIDSWFV